VVLMAGSCHPAWVNRRGWIQMGLLAALWGASYMFIKVALDDDVSEGVIICLRTLLGAAVLVPLALRAGALRPLMKARWWNLALALAQVIVPFGLITFGENHIPSALAGILIASEPLFLALIATWLDRSERAQGWSLVGVLLGMAGVVLLFGIDLSGDVETLLGGLMIIGASLSYAYAALIVKRGFPGVPPVGIAASAMVISALAWLPIALASLPDHVPGLAASSSLLALGAGGTGIAFLLFYRSIAEVGPARASIVSYIAPAFAVLYGVLLLGEHLGTATICGLALIVAGSWLAAQGALPWRSKAEASVTLGANL
jgi:drug/metabolite transporter (DMT)-like permease